MPPAGIVKSLYAIITVEPLPLNPALVPLSYEMYSSFVEFVLILLIALPTTHLLSGLLLSDTIVQFAFSVASSNPFQ